MSLHRQILQDSPLGYWPLDELTGTTAFDRSGNGKNGTYTNGPTLGNKDGPFVCPSFDGTDDHVTIPDAAQVFAGANFTVECWFRTADTGYTSLFAKYNTYQTNTKWNIRIINTNKAAMYCDGSVSTAHRDALTTSNDNKWHHAVGLFISSGSDVQFWLDGVQQATGAQTGLYAATQSTSPLIIAAYDGSAGTGEFTNAYIAHCAFYGSVLTADRIKAHYEAARRSGVTV